MKSSLQQEAVNQYSSFISQNSVISNTSNKDGEMVKRVGKRIAAAITKYYNDKACPETRRIQMGV